MSNLLSALRLSLKGSFRVRAHYFGIPVMINEIHPAFHIILTFVTLTFYSKVKKVSFQRNDTFFSNLYQTIMILK